MSRNLPDWITSYLEYQEDTEPPLLFKEWAAVSAIAACMQRKCWTEWECSIYPNLFVIIIGPSGCRKGTAMRPVETMLGEVGIPMSAESTTREALIKRIASIGSTEIDPETMETIIHHSITIFSPELAVFLGYENRQLISDLTDLFDCREKWSYVTKGKGEDNIYNVCVNMIGATTPTLLQSMLPKDAMSGGLLSRTIFVYGNKRHKIVPLPLITPRMKELKVLLTQDLEMIRAMAGQFKASSESLDKYVRWYTDHCTTNALDDSNLLPYLERRQLHLRKLSMIMSVSRGDDMIVRGEDFDRALELLERTEKEMPKVFSGYGAHKQAALFPQVMTFVRTRKTVCFNEVLAKFYRELDETEMRSLLATLAGMGFCIVETKGTKTMVTYIGEQDND